MKASRLVSIPLFCGLLFGYHMGVIAPALPLLKAKFILNEWLLAHLVSSFILGLIIGALFTSYVLKYITRKTALLIGFSLCGTLAIFGYVANDLTSLIFYRVFSGISCGMLATLGPMVSVENGAISKRSKLVSLFQLFIALGVACSYLSGLWCLEDKATEVMFLLPFVPSTIAFFMALNIPKLQVVYQNTAFEFVKFKKSYFVALGLNFFQQASGINAITFFIQSILLEQLDGSVKLSYIMPISFNIVSLIGTLFLMSRVEVLGRKKFLYLGAIGMAICMALIGLNHLSFWTGFSILIGFTLFFSLSFGPLTYLIGNEVFPDYLRSKGAALAFFVNCLTNYGISLVFLPLSHRFGLSFMWIFFAIMSLLALIFAFKVVPETAHKRLDSIVKKLNRG